MSDQTESYRLVAVRRASIAQPADLSATVEWLLKTLQTDEPALFTLSGLSPAMNTIPVLNGDECRVSKFLSTSEIQWNFGRAEADPTHEVAFFNEHEDGRQVYLRISFVAEGAECEGPGLVAELRLGLDAAGPRDNYRGAFLDKLFSCLISALRPDFGHIELPGHPGVLERPAEYQVGWVTYLTKGEVTIPPLEPPAVVVAEDGGTKILATRGLALENYADVAKHIQAVKDALQPEPLAEPTADDTPPAAAPPMQQASYMGGRPTGAFASLDDEKTDIGPLGGGGAALPFARGAGGAAQATPPPLQIPNTPPFLSSPIGGAPVSTATPGLPARLASMQPSPAQTGPVFQPPAQTGPTFQPPTGPAFQPPAQTGPVFQPPAQTGPAFQPPAQTGPTFQPPTQGPTFQPAAPQPAAPPASGQTAPQPPPLIQAPLPPPPALLPSLMQPAVPQPAPQAPPAVQSQPSAKAPPSVHPPRPTQSTPQALPPGVVPPPPGRPVAPPTFGLPPPASTPVAAPPPAAAPAPPADEGRFRRPQTMVIVPGAESPVDPAKPMPGLPFAKPGKDEDPNKGSR